MTTTIDLAQSRPTLEDLLALTAAGTEVILVNAGAPVATLSPAPTPPPPPETLPPRIPGQQPGAFTYVSEDFDDPLPDEFWLSGDP